MDPAMDLLDTQDTHATNLPDPSAPWVQKLMRLTPADVLREAIETWPQLKQAAWKFAFLLQRIQAEGLYRPHDSLTAWARAELGKDSAVVSKYRQAGEFVLSLEDPQERAQVMQTPPATISEAGIPRLAKKNRSEAIRLAGAGMSQRELVQAVRVQEADDLHLDTGPLKTFKLLLTADAHKALLGVWHLIRFQCQTPHPTDSELAQLLAAEYHTGLQIDPAILERFPLEAIEAGEVKCLECGATNPNMLEGHHVVPKSHQGHDGPIVWLCMKNHEKVTQNYDGGWRGHLIRWMARPELRWLKEAIENWLKGRKLEDL